MSKVDKITKYGLFLILFLPLLFTSFTFFPWHYGKTMIFQIIVEFLVFLYLIRSIHKLSLRRWLKSLNFLDWFVLAFLVFIFVTALTGVNPANSFWGNQARANGVFAWWHFGAFYFLMMWVFKNRCRERACLFPTIAVIVSVLASLTSFFPQILPADWQSTAGGGIIGNRAFLAAYLILAVGLCFYLFFSRERIYAFPSRWRWLFIGMAIVNLAAIYLSGNRGSLLGLTVGLVAGLVISVFLVSNKRYKIIIGSILIVLCSLFFVLFLLYQNQTFQARAPRLANLFNLAAYTTGTAETRLMAWQAGWQGLKDRPLFGWGWGNYEIIFNKYYNPQFLGHGFTETVWDKPHNWFLEIGESAGIFGIISYLAILFFAFYYLLKKAKAGGIILFSSLLAYFVQSLFLFETTYSLILWFLILAMISALDKNGLISYQEEKVNIPRSFIKILNIKYLILFIVLFLSLYYLYFLPLKSSYYMRQAELSNTLMDWVVYAKKATSIAVSFLPENAIFLAQKFGQFDKSGAIVNNKEVEETALAITEILEKYSSKNPQNLSFPTWAGQVYMILGEKIDAKYLSDAERVLLRAVAIAPQKQETLFLLSRLYLLKKDFGKALETQKQAVAIAPNINISHWFLGLAYVASGNRVDGLKEIEKAQELGYILSSDQELYVLDLYALEKDYLKLIEKYKEKIDEDPENVNWYIKLATVYAVFGDKKSALELVDQIVIMAPTIKAEAEKFIKEYKLR